MIFTDDCYAGNGRGGRQLSEHATDELPPSRKGSDLGPVLIDLIPVVLTETSVEVEIVNGDPLRTLPEVADDPEDDNDRNGENVLQNTRGSVLAAIIRNSSNV